MASTADKPAAAAAGGTLPESFRVSRTISSFYTGGRILYGAGSGKVYSLCSEGVSRPRCLQSVRLRRSPPSQRPDIHLQPVSSMPSLGTLGPVRGVIPARGAHHQRPPRLCRSIGPHVQRPLPRRSQHQHNADDLGPLLTITGCSSKTLEGGNSRAYRSRTYNASKAPHDCRQSVDNCSSTTGLRPTGLEGYGKDDDDILADDGDDDEWFDDDDDEEDIATSDGQGDRELECGLTARELLDLLSRDITPDDYDTLLKLDQRVPPKTAKPESISNLRVLTRAEVKALASPGDDAGGACEKCGVCLCSILEEDVQQHQYGSSSSSSSSSIVEVEADIVQLPRCGHIFHGKCAREWLGKFGRTCPIDRVEVDEDTS